MRVPLNDDWIVEKNTVIKEYGLGWTQGFGIKGDGSFRIVTIWGLGQMRGIGCRNKTDYRSGRWTSVLGLWTLSRTEGMECVRSSQSRYNVTET